ncbi:cytochrome P450 [uncultured Nostoc sp.]|uniref:cytochrome P450 n=1 Tax=uncultured Nostoc sp. TaxID=340711 RepID=UPI0035CAAB87
MLKLQDTSRSNISMRLPDGPQTPPVVQTIQWLGRTVELMDTCAQRYGETFTLRLINSKPVVFFSNPQAIRQIFTADPKKFQIGKGNEALRSFLGATSVVVVDGNRHQRQRQLLMPQFHGERMRAYGELMCSHAEEVASQWVLGQPFSPHFSTQEMSMGVILQAVFGLYEGERFEKLKQLLTSVLAIGDTALGNILVFSPLVQWDLGPWSPWGRFLHEMRQIDEILYAEMRERRAKPDPSRIDIFNMLLSARDEDGQLMTDVEVRDELITLLIAGHETTAISLAWALYCIHSVPEVQRKLQEELDTLGDNPDPSQIIKLPYLTAVCQETLRLYPVLMVTFPRIVESPIEIMGNQFEPGTILYPCVYLAHRNEDIYPQPTTFRPERFLERQFTPYEYFPFGGANRRCIGMAFAQFEMKLVLATILSRLELKLVDNCRIKPVRRLIGIMPSAGKWLVATSQRHLKKSKINPAVSQ